MKHIFTTILLLCINIFIYAQEPSGSGITTEHTLKHKGVEYTYYLYKPQNLPPDAPLVLVFHGYGVTTFPSEVYGFNPVADKYGFAVSISSNAFF